MPHGVDFELFSTAADPGETPTDLMSVPTPRIGFVGALAHWLDYDLLLRIARARRDWSFCFVGPVGPHVDIRPLAKEPNVRLFGLKKREQTIGYMRGFDVCIVPFAINNLTLCSNPLKTLDYLAAGKPVVSTPLPEIERLSPPVRIAAEPKAFVDAIAEALTCWTDQDRTAAMSLAAQCSWESRTSEALQTIYERLDAKPPVGASP
jgi:glycosyltransferase involved in cell wall biosynthesis